MHHECGKCGARFRDEHDCPEDIDALHDTLENVRADLEAEIDRLETALRQIVTTIETADRKTFPEETLTAVIRIAKEAAPTEG